jgi:hypothetical protein
MVVSVPENVFCKCGADPQNLDGVCFPEKSLSKDCIGEIKLNQRIGD